MRFILEQLLPLTLTLTILVFAVSSKIVMGSQGDGPLCGLYLRSVSAKVIAGSTPPVTIVRLTGYRDEAWRLRSGARLLAELPFGVELRRQS